MVELDRLLDAIYLGNSVWQWTLAAATALAVLLALLLLRRLIRARYAAAAATPQLELLELPLQVASRTTAGFLLVAALFAGLMLLRLPANVARLLQTAFTIAVFWQVGVWATTAVLASLERKERSALASDRGAASSLGIIGFVARATIWSFVLLLTLDNLGVQIKSLLAGLGIGGIAVALAAQNILGDLFASLSITLDRPFVVGDALQIDDFNGTVEYIGVKSTRLRSLSGEQIVIPNSNMVSSRLRNHTRLRERRVVYAFSVDPQTSREQLERIPPMLRQFIETYPDVRFDRAHFTKIGTASFDFEAVYIVLKPDYGRHMDIQQDLNLRVLQALEREGILLAHPKQRLYVERSSDQAAIERA